MTHLNHADLTVGDTNQTLVDETIVVGVTWLALHDVTLSLLVSQRDGGHLSQTTINSFDFDKSIKHVQINHKYQLNTN